MGHFLNCLDIPLTYGLVMGDFILCDKFSFLIIKSKMCVLNMNCFLKVLNLFPCTITL